MWDVDTGLFGQEHHASLLREAAERRAAARLPRPHSNLITLTWRALLRWRAAATSAGVGTRGAVAPTPIGDQSCHS